MKLAVIDGYTMNPGDLSWQQYEQFGELSVYQHATDDENEVINRIGGAEIVIANKSKVTRRVIDACSHIRFITVQATGYDPIDYVYAREKGIPVSNVPAYGTASVAQYAISLLLEICGHVGHHSDAVAKGEWAKRGDWCFWDYSPMELENKTMGIIGLGRIGQITSRVAQAFGMKVLAYDSYQNESLVNENCHYTDLDTLLANSDVIALHCPLFAETENIINKDTIAKMKDGVIIINNSRGALIVEEDLAEALNSGKVYAAGLDAVRNEPITMDNPLLSAKNCYITPHISWAALECRQRLIDYSLDNLRCYMDGNPTNIVNGVK